MNETVFVIYCVWQNKSGCGVNIEGAYKDKDVAESMKATLQKAAERWNKKHPDSTERYELEEVIVKDTEA